MSQVPLATPNPNTIDLKNVQGDVIPGFPKRKEEFIFFVIQDAGKFKELLPDLKVTTAAETIEARKAIQRHKYQQSRELLPVVFLNIAFSNKGLDALGITDHDDLGDPSFARGQLENAEDLGDDGVMGPDGFEPSWETAFKHRLDGVFIVAGESWASIDALTVKVLDEFSGALRVEYRLKGSVRPGDQKGHEHFGWKDGISDPAVEGIGKPWPGQRVVPPGVILCGKAKDTVTERPEWALEGSFLAFRQLEQLVPEFHKFLADNPVVLPGLSREHGSELLGAQLVGRWKSGAPIQKAPAYDWPQLGNDPQHNNDFEYPQDPGDAGQAQCPYAAHIRKTNPRNDLEKFEGAVEQASIIRAGIPYGPEVTFGEKREHFTEFKRGLAFVSYQSSLANGFEFVQKSWANATDFPPEKCVNAGFDPIVGQKNGQPRRTLGTSNGSKLTLPRDFVVSRGGEYFFSPSIRALQTKFAGVDSA